MSLCPTCPHTRLGPVLLLSCSLGASARVSVSVVGDCWAGAGEAKSGPFTAQTGVPAEPRAEEGESGRVHLKAVAGGRAGRPGGGGVWACQSGAPGKNQEGRGSSPRARAAVSAPLPLGLLPPCRVGETCSLSHAELCAGPRPPSSQTCTQPSLKVT